MHTLSYQKVVDIIKREIDISYSSIHLQLIQLLYKSKQKTNLIPLKKSLKTVTQTSDLGLRNTAAV
jgi:hypothetical protein